jgi:hypothetical protein
MENTIQYKRAFIFFDKKIKVHAVLNYGYFLNGLIVELQKEYFVLKEFNGDQKTIFFSELKLPLEKYKEREEW